MTNQAVRSARFILGQLVIVAVIFMILEVACRFAGYPYEQVGIPHPVYHHSKIPNGRGILVKQGEFSCKIITNQYGMRDGERSLKKDPSVYRILVLGDSFAEGFGVQHENSFCYLAEQMLNATSLGYEILNGGNSSYSPLLEYLYYKNFAHQFKPDLVILFLDWSDIQDDYRYAKLAKTDVTGEIISVGDPDATVSGPGKLARLSALLNYWYWQKPDVFIRRQVVGKFLKFFFGDTWYREMKRKSGAMDLQVKVGNLESDRYLIFRDGAGVTLKTEIARTQSYIKNLSELVRQNGQHFALALYPYGVQVNEKEWLDGKEYYGFERNKVYGQYVPFQIFESFAKENGILVLNLSTDLKRVSDPAKGVYLYYPEDGHFNVQGNKVVADALSRFVRDFVKTHIREPLAL